MKLSDTFGFNAPPEVLFNNLTDAQRATRWLPAGLRLERRDGDGLRVVDGEGDDAGQYVITVDPARLRVAWEQVGAPDSGGVASVQDGPVGGSHLRVSINAPDSPRSPQRFRELLDQAMRRLDRDLDDNFNAG